MDEEQMHLLRDGYQYFVGHQGWRPYSHLLVKLEPETIRLIEHLYLNNYEISEWEGYFLTLWSSQPDIDYISSRKLLTRLGVADIPLYDTFFAPFQGHVSISVFIEFLCTFAFFTINQLLPLVLSMSNIKSNKLITDDQVLSFFRSLNLIHPKSCEIATWLNHVQRDKNGYISLSTFNDFVLRDLSLIYPLCTIKTRLIETIIGESEFSHIVQRQQYYNEKEKNETAKPPPEGCCNKIGRFITHKPPLLYYNYRPQAEASIDLALYYLRTKFGYSVRPHRVSSASLSLSITKKRSIKNEMSNSLCRDNNKISSRVKLSVNNLPATSSNYHFSSQCIQNNNSLTPTTTTPVTVPQTANSNRNSNIIIPKKSVFESMSNRNLNSIEVKCKP